MYLFSHAGYNFLSGKDQVNTNQNFLQSQTGNTDLTESQLLHRCCKLDIHGPDPSFWDDLEAKIMECIRNTLDRRIQFYEEEIRKLSEQRFMPVWNFCNFFILKVLFLLQIF